MFFPTDACSCPPFDCSCFNSTRKLFGHVTSGHSPLALPETDLFNTSTDLFNNKFETYSPQFSAEVPSFENNVQQWTPEWSNQINFKSDTENWNGWPGIGDQQASQVNIPVFNGIHDPSPQLQSTFPNHQHTSFLPNYEQNESSLRHSEHNNSFTFDNIQPSDIFALDANEVQYLHENINNGTNIHNNPPYFLNSEINSTSNGESGDMSASRFLQCLDEFLGDCFTEESSTESSSFSSTCNENNSTQLTREANKFPIVYPPQNELAKKSNDIKLNAEHHPIDVISKDQTNSEGNKINLTENVVFKDEGKSFDCTFNTSTNTSFPKHNVNEILSNIDQNYPIISKFTSTNPLLPTTVSSANSLLSSPPTFQNLDTLETTTGSPISFTDDRCQSCPTVNNSYQLNVSGMNCNDYSLVNSPNSYASDYSNITQLNNSDSSSATYLDSVGCDIRLYSSSFTQSYPIDIPSQLQPTDFTVVNPYSNDQFRVTTNIL